MKQGLNGHPTDIVRRRWALAVVQLNSYQDMTSEELAGYVEDRLEYTEEYSAAPTPYHIPDDEATIKTMEIRAFLEKVDNVYRIKSWDDGPLGKTIQFYGTEDEVHTFLLENYGYLEEALETLETFEWTLYRI